MKYIVIQALLLFLLLGFVFPDTFLHGEVIAPADLLFPQRPWSEHAPEDFTQPQNALMPDIVAAFMPYYAAANFALNEGCWPLWNPYEFGGMPLMANCQSAVFYPPRVLHYAFGLFWGQTLFILFKLWCCGMLAFLCARPLGLQRGWDHLFSILWMLASYNQIWCNWSLPDVSLWLPLLVAGIELILGAKYRQGFFAITTAGCGLLLAGHPETAFMMALGAGTYFALRLLLDGGYNQLFKKAVVCLGGWGVALLVTAPQWLPFSEYLTQSYTFFERAESHADMVYSPGEIISAWVPRFYGTWFDDNHWGNLNSNLLGMLYIGLTAWVGLMLHLSMRKENPALWKRCLANSIPVAMGVGIAFNMPSLQWVHSMPIFNTVLASYHITYSIFALPLLGVLGLQQWCSRPRKSTQLWPVLLTALFVAGLITFVYRFNLAYMTQVGVLPFVHKQLIIAGAVFLLALVCMALQHRLPKTLFIALLCILGAGDLLYANRGLNVTMSPEQVYPDTQLTQVLQDLGRPARISHGEGFIPSGLTVPYGIEDWLAYDGLYPDSMMRFQIKMGGEVWNAMEPACAKTWYLHHDGQPHQFPIERYPDRFEKVGSYEGISLYKNKVAFPRAYLVGGISLFEESQALFTHMRKEEFKPGQQVAALHTDALAASTKHLPEATPIQGTATITSYRSTEVVIEVDAKQDCILVLADTYFPGWHVTIDDTPSTIFPAYYAFRGVTIPEGQHTLRFTYWPRSLSIGLILSFIGMALGLLIAWRTWKMPQARA